MKTTNNTKCTLGFGITPNQGEDKLSEIRESETKQLEDVEIVNEDQILNTQSQIVLHVSYRVKSGFKHQRFGV